MNDASWEIWEKCKDSQIRINWEDQENDNNSWLILPSRVRKKVENVQHFRRIIQGGLLLYCLRCLILKPPKDKFLSKIQY